MSIRDYLLSVTHFHCSPQITNTTLLKSPKLSQIVSGVQTGIHMCFQLPTYWKKVCPSCTSNYSRLRTSKYNIAWVLRNSNLTKDNTLKTRVESYLVAAMLSPWLYPIKQRAVIFKEFWFQRPEDSKGRLQRWKFAFLTRMLTFVSSNTSPQLQ